MFVYVYPRSNTILPSVIFSKNFIYFGHRALDLFQAKRQQFPRLQSTLHPGGWRLQISIQRQNKWVNVRKPVNINILDKKPVVSLALFVTNLSHCLQKCTVTCLGIPSEMSTWVRKQATHMLAGLGGIGTPHVQHRLQKREATIIEMPSTVLLARTEYPQIALYLEGNMEDSLKLTIQQYIVHLITFPMHPCHH